MIGTLIENLIPLYILIALGFVAGRYLDVNLHSISRICIFILSPIVFLGACMRLQLNPALIGLPLITSASSFMITLGTLWIAKKYWQDGTANSIASAAVNANAVYFGLPIIIALFGETGAAIYLFMNLGGAINNTSLSYYISARGRFTVRDSLIKLVKFPVLYAVILGLALNVADVEMPAIAQKYWHYSTGALTMLGMMMIGVSVSKLKKLEIYWPEIGALCLVKYGAWPIALGGFAFFDAHVTHLFDNQIYAMMLMLSVMPLFANYVAYSAENDLFPERAGMSVLLSSVASIVIIPAMLLFIRYLGL